MKRIPRSSTDTSADSLTAPYVSPVMPPSILDIHQPSPSDTASAPPANARPAAPEQQPPRRESRRQAERGLPPAAALQERRAEPLCPRIGEGRHGRQHPKPREAREQHEQLPSHVQWHAHQQRPLEQQQRSAARHGKRAHVRVAQDAQTLLPCVPAEEPVARVEEALGVDGPRQRQQHGHQHRPHERAAAPRCPSASRGRPESRPAPVPRVERTPAKPPWTPADRHQPAES